MYYNQKVDFLSLYLSPTYYQYLTQYEGATPDDFPTPNWSEERHLVRMDQLGIAFAFLSVSSPNLSKADQQTQVRMVHQINLEGAEIVKCRPDRLGLFAGLPLPHTEQAIVEARFAKEQLRADGFGLSTNYAGVYLGDARYDDLMAYLNSIGAVVAVHPVKPSGLPRGVNSELPIPAMEFFMDTTRTFTHMVMHDIFGRFPNIKWIFPHAGAFLPILSDRMSGFALQFRSNMQKPMPLDFKTNMKHVYFDEAGFPVNKQLHDLLLDVPVDNLLYGSDMPYTPVAACVAQTGLLETVSGMSKTDKSAMFTYNAVRLMPQLADVLQVSVSGKSVCYRDQPLTVKEKISRTFRLMLSKLYAKVFQ